MFTIYGYNPNIDPQGTTGAIRFFGAYEGKVTNVFTFNIVDIQFYIDEEPPIIPGFDSVKTTKARCKATPIPKEFNVNYVIEGKYLINVPEDAFKTPGEWVDIPYSEVSFAEYFIHGSRPGYTKFEFLLCIGDSDYYPSSVHFLNKRGGLVGTKYSVLYDVDEYPEFRKFMTFNRAGTLDRNDPNFGNLAYSCDKDLGKAIALRDTAEAYYRKNIFIVLKIIDANFKTTYLIYR